MRSRRPRSFVRTSLAPSGARRPRGRRLRAATASAVETRSGSEAVGIVQPAADPRDRFPLQVAGRGPRARRRRRATGAGGVRPRSRPDPADPPEGACAFRRTARATSPRKRGSEARPARAARARGRAPRSRRPPADPSRGPAAERGPARRRRSTSPEATRASEVPCERHALGSAQAGARRRARRAPRRALARSGSSRRPRRSRRPTRGRLRPRARISPSRADSTRARAAPRARRRARTRAGSSVFGSAGRAQRPVWPLRRAGLAARRRTAPRPRSTGAPVWSRNVPRTDADLAPGRGGERGEEVRRGRVAPGVAVEVGLHAAAEDVLAHPASNISSTASPLRR